MDYRPTTGNASPYHQGHVILLTITHPRPLCIVLMHNLCSLEVQMQRTDGAQSVGKEVAIGKHLPGNEFEAANCPIPRCQTILQRLNLNDFAV